MSKERNIHTLSIDGNCLCFNFINTVYSRTEEEEPFEYLDSYDTLLKWCRRLKVLPSEQIQRLSVYVKSHPEEADDALKELITARELLYLFFSAIAANKHIKNQRIEKFNHYLSLSLEKLRFISGDHGPQLDWKDSETNLKAPLWRVMKSAYDILTNESMKRIKECEGCGWLFLDLSKNNSRRWCNMQTCGSIHKAKKYYYRKKKEKSSS